MTKMLFELSDTKKGICRIIDCEVRGQVQGQLAPVAQGIINGKSLSLALFSLCVGFISLCNASGGLVL